MKQVICSIVKAVCKVRHATIDARQGEDFRFAPAPMIALGVAQLHQVVGGDDGDLPKGGWKAVTAA